MIGHDALNICNDLGHLILDNVCEFIEPVVHRVNPTIHITRNRAGYICRNVYYEKSENHQYIYIMVHIPGVKKDDVNVSLYSSVLTLTAKTDVANTFSCKDHDWSFVKNILYHKQFNLPNASNDMKVIYTTVGALQLIIKKEQQN